MNPVDLFEWNKMLYRLDWFLSTGRSLGLWSKKTDYEAYYKASNRVMPGS